MTAEKLNREALDFIYEHIKDGPAQQTQLASDLDGKLFQFFTVASVVIGFAGIGTIDDLEGRESWWMLLATAAFTVVGAAMLGGTWVVKWRETVHGAELWQEHWNSNVEDVKHALVDDIEKSCAENAKRLKRKALFLKYAMLATAIEVFAVSLSVFMAVRA